MRKNNNNKKLPQSALLNALLFPKNCALPLLFSSLATMSDGDFYV